jgi:hypothetical protein
MMANFEIKRRDSKTGNKQEKIVRKLSAAEAEKGRWARAAVGALHHFFIEGTSVCGQKLPEPARADATRKLCPECYSAVNRAVSFGGALG